MNRERYTCSNFTKILIYFLAQATACHLLQPKKRRTSQKHSTTTSDIMPDGDEDDVVQAATKIQAAFRGHKVPNIHT